MQRISVTGESCASVQQQAALLAHLKDCFPRSSTRRSSPPPRKKKTGVAPLQRRRRGQWQMAGGRGPCNHHGRPASTPPPRANGPVSLPIQHVHQRKNLCEFLRRQCLPNGTVRPWSTGRSHRKRTGCLCNQEGFENGASTSTATAKIIRLAEWQRQLPTTFNYIRAVYQRPPLPPASVRDGRRRLRVAVVQRGPGQPAAPPADQRKSSPF